MYDEFMHFRSALLKKQKTRSENVGKPCAKEDDTFQMRCILVTEVLGASVPTKWNLEYKFVAC